MTFRPALWYPIAVVLSVLNVVGVAFAVGPAEPWHATIHAALAVGFGLWAQRLRQGSGSGALQDALQALEIEVSALRHELSEAQERLDFAERVMAQKQEAPRVGPERGDSYGKSG
jgi:hypothetical protein